MQEDLVDRDDLGNFVNGYLRAVFETPNDDWFGDGKPFGENYTKYDISERTLRQMIRDCLNFYWRHRAVLEELYRHDLLSEKKAGYKFWKSRNGYSLGFGDNKTMDVTWDLLENGSRGYSKFKLTVNMEGKIDADYSQAPRLS